MKVSVQVNMTEQTTGKNISRSYTSINPNATNAQLLLFGQGIASLTTNTYGTTKKIAVTDLDTESGE